MEKHIGKTACTGKTQILCRAEARWRRHTDVWQAAGTTDSAQNLFFTAYVFLCGGSFSCCIFLNIFYKLRKHRNIVDFIVGNDFAFIFRAKTVKPNRFYSRVLSASYVGRNTVPYHHCL